MCSSAPEWCSWATSSLEGWWRKLSELEKLFNKKLFVWGGIFALGAACGALGHKAILPHMVSLIDVGLRASGRLSAGSGVEAALFIFMKNLSVVFLCALLGRGTRGTFPALVCFINGGILGFLGAVMRAYGGVSWWRYVAVLSPHGVLELAAVFAACTIGLLAASVKEKLCLLKIPFAMLAAAACLEVWVSSGLANRIL